MRIGVITHYRTDDNYGAVLQCYALQKYLNSKGHDAFLIDYSESSKSFKKSVLDFVKSIGRVVICLFSTERRRKYKEIQYYVHLREKNKILNKDRCFAEFLRDNLKFSSIAYKSIKHLQKNPPQANIYITGSDQVWNPPLALEATCAWYLNFGSSFTKRISYAASIGRDITKQEETQFKAYLDRFDAISVREQSALDFCFKMGYKGAQLVLDPTLLATIDLFLPLIKPEFRIKNRFLFLYYLNVENDSDIKWSQIEQFLIAKDLEIVSVGSSGYLPAIEILPSKYKNSNLTIPQWLSSVYYSECVVTTSFHGTAFAILMHRPFVAILLNNKYSSGNGRILSLLNLLHLENRILTDRNTLNEIMTIPIDWDNVDRILRAERLKSRRFLEKYI